MKFKLKSKHAYFTIALDQAKNNFFGRIILIEEGH